MAAEQQVTPTTINMRMMVVDETGQWVPLKSTNDGLNMTPTTTDVTALSVRGNPSSDTAPETDITASTDHQVLRRSGTSVAFGQVNLAQSAAVTGILPPANGGLGTSTLPSSAQIPVGNGSDVYTPRTMSGDATMDNTGVLTLASLGYSKLSSAAVTSLQRKNRIINGDMRINQRNPTASGASTTDGGYTVDRFLTSRGGSYGGTLTWAYDSGPTLVQTGEMNFRRAIKLSTTQDTTPSTDGYCLLSTRLEGQDVSDIMDASGNCSAFTLSFWTKNSRAGTYCAFIKNSVGTRTYTSAYTVAANTWTKVTVSVPASAVGGSWNVDNTLGLNVGWCLVSGTDFDDGVNNTWVSSNEFCNSSQQNWADVASDFWLTGVQLEPGTSATPFEFRPFQQELALCQRYYEKSYDLDTVPGTATSNGRIMFSSGVNLTGANQFWAGTVFKVTKRIAPTTLTIYDQSTNSARVTGLTAAGGTTNNIAYNSAESHADGLNISLANTSYAGFLFHFTADAEL